MCLPEYCDRVMCVRVLSTCSHLKCKLCVRVCAVIREDGALLVPVREREKEGGRHRPPFSRFTSPCSLGRPGQCGDFAMPPEPSQNVAEKRF